MNFHSNQQSIFRLQHASETLQKRLWRNQNLSSHCPTATLCKQSHFARLRLASAVLIALGMQPKKRERH